MKIVKVETVGSKYGLRGDAEVRIVFDPVVPDDAGLHPWEFAWEDRRPQRAMLGRNRNIVVSRIASFNSEDGRVHGLVTYAPRIDFTSDVKDWKMEPLGNLLSIAREYGQWVESFVAPGQLAERVRRLFDKLNVSPGITYDSATGVFRVRVSIGSSAYTYQSAKMSKYTEPTDFWNRKYESTEEVLTLSTAEMAAYSEAQADALVHKLADQLNDTMLRLEAIYMLGDLFKTDGTGLLVWVAGDSNEARISSSLSRGVKCLPFTNGKDLMRQVKSLDLVSLKKDLKHDEAEKQAATDEEQAALERKQERLIEKAAKQKLADQWAAICAQAADFEVEGAP